MREFVVMADSDSEIPYQYADAHELPVFLMPYTIDGQRHPLPRARRSTFRTSLKNSWRRARIFYTSAFLPGFRRTMIWCRSPKKLRWKITRMRASKR